MNRYIMTDGVKSIDLPQFPNEAWTFYSGDNSEGKEDFYGRVSSVFRAFNITADVTAAIPFALVDKSGNDYDISTEWENKVGFMKYPKELIRLWRMSLSATNSAYGFMENIRGEGKNLRYILPSSITPLLDREHGNGLIGFKRTVGTRSDEYALGKKNPIFWMWRRDHTTELLPAKATQFQALCAAAGILYYSDNHIQAFFKRGGIKPTMLVLKGMTTKDQIEKIEGIWTKIISGAYKYLGKVFQGVDASGGLEALPIGEGVDNLKDETLTRSKVEDIAMAMGIPLSIMLANSANYATAQVEYKSWYDTSLAPWCSFMAEEMTDKLFKPLNLRFEFRPEMTDPGQEDEVARASAYSTYVNAGIKPSIAAQVIGMELPQGIEFATLDAMQEEKQQQAIELMQEKKESSDTEDEEEKPDAVQKEKEKVKGWVTINGNHVLIDGEYEVNANRINEYISLGYIPVYRGASEAGMNNMRPSEDGVYGSGVYFYTDPTEARSYATWPNGGVIVGFVNQRDAEIHGNVLVLKNPKDFVLGGKIPLEETSLEGDKWITRTQVELSKAPPLNKSYGNKFVPSLDQLKEMDIWRKFAFRHFKKGEPLTFAFEVKTLPDDIAEGIRCGLEIADSEDAIKQVFDIDAVEPVETKSDYAILELADAINKACENVTITE